MLRVRPGLHNWTVTGGVQGSNCLLLFPSHDPLLCSGPKRIKFTDTREDGGESQDRWRAGGRDTSPDVALPSTRPSGPVRCLQIQAGPQPPPARSRCVLASSAFDLGGNSVRRCKNAALTLSL